MDNGQRGLTPTALLGLAALLAGASCGRLYEEEVDDASASSASRDAGPDGRPLESPTPDADASPPPIGVVDSGVSVDGGRAPLACPAGALLCDDFEVENFARWSRTFAYATGQRSIAQQQVYSGQRSLHVSVGNAGSATGIGVSFDLPSPLTSGTFAARAYVYGPSNPLMWTDLMRLVSGQGYTSIGVAGSSWRTYLSDNPIFLSSDPFRPGEWMCVEWLVDLGSPGHLSVYVDENPIINEVTNTVPPSFTGYTRFEFGIVFNDGQHSADLYFDDLVIGTSRVKCH
jgi:hypothetical protein